MFILSFGRMNEAPEAVKERLRVLTFGREYDSPMYSWTFNDGSCWYATLSLSEEMPLGSTSTPSESRHQESRILAWACLTSEVDHFPVVGVYTDPDHRGKGLARVVTGHLLRQADLPHSTPIYAVSENWPSWPQVLRNFGLVHFEWE